MGEEDNKGLGKGPRTSLGKVEGHVRILIKDVVKGLGPSKCQQSW